MDNRFESDSKKANRNLGKLGVAFAEASTVFADPLAVTLSDVVRSIEEERFYTMGLSHRGRFLVVSHTYRSEMVRIISARTANSRERIMYETSN